MNKECQILISVVAKSARKRRENLARVEELENEIMEKENMINELRAGLEELREKKESLESSVQSFMALFEREKVRRQDAEIRLAEEREEIGRMKDDITRLEGCVAKLQQDKGDMDKHVGKISISYNRMRTQISNLNSEAEHMSALVKIQSMKMASQYEKPDVLATPAKPKEDMPRQAGHNVPRLEAGARAQQVLKSPLPTRRELEAGAHAQQVPSEVSLANTQRT